MSKIKGEDLMVFLGGKSIAFGTNHTITISAETSDTSNKDETSGGWTSAEVSKLSWTGTSENLMANTGKGVTYQDLVGYMTSKTPLDFVFGGCKETEPGDEGFTLGTGVASLAGKAYITNLQVNAQDGEQATYTVDFTGTGALTKTDAATTTTSTTTSSGS